MSRGRNQAQWGSHNTTPRSDYPDQLFRERQILIRILSYGYLVTVGCSNFAIEKRDVLLKNLEVYLKDPAAVERAWQKKSYKI